MSREKVQFSRRMNRNFMLSANARITSCKSPNFTNWQRNKCNSRTHPQRKAVRLTQLKNKFSKETLMFQVTLCQDYLKTSFCSVNFKNLEKTDPINASFNNLQCRKLFKLKPLVVDRACKYYLNPRMPSFFLCNSFIFEFTLSQFIVNMDFAASVKNLFKKRDFKEEVEKSLRDGRNFENVAPNDTLIH